MGTNHDPSFIPAPVVSPGHLESLEPRLMLSVTLGGTNISHTFQTAAGTNVTAILQGPGTATLNFTEPDATSGDLVSIVTEGTTLLSSLIVRSGGPIEIETLTVNDSLNQLVAPLVDVTGDVVIEDLVRFVQLRNMASDAQQSFTIGGLEAGDEAPPVPVTATVLLGQVQDLTFSSAVGLNLLRATAWLDRDAPEEGDPVADVVTAPYINILQVLGGVGVEGDFEADLALSGEGSPFRLALNSAFIRGDLRDAAWTFDGDVDADGTVDATPDVGQVLVFGETRNVAITIGEAPEGVVRRMPYLRLGDVGETTIDSAVGIGTLFVTRWMDAVAGEDPGTTVDVVVDAISAPSINHLLAIGAGPATPGDFQADLNLTGAGNPFGLALNVATIYGSLTDAVWTFDGDADDDGTPESAPRLGSLHVLRNTRSFQLNVGDSPEGTLQRGMVLRLGDVADSAIDSGQGIQLLFVTRWLDAIPDTDPAVDAIDDVITAPWIGTLFVLGGVGISGDFEADLNVSGAGSPFRSALANVLVRGNVVASSWVLDGDLDGDGTIDALPDLGALTILGDTRGFLLSIGGAPDGTALRRNPVIRLGTVAESRIESQAGLSMLMVNNWLDADNDGTDEVEDAVIAPWIGTLYVLGTPATDVSNNFEADLNLSGAGSPFRSALSAGVVRGNVVNAEWTFIGDVDGDGTVEAIPDLGSLVVLGDTDNFGLTIGEAPANTPFRRNPVLRFRDMSNTRVVSSPGILSLVARRWLDANPTTGADTGEDLLEAPFVNQLFTLGTPDAPGDFQADVDLSGDGRLLAGNRRLGSGYISGNLTDSTFDVDGHATSLNVLGLVDRTTMNINGNATIIRFRDLGANGDITVAGDGFVVTGQPLGVNAPASDTDAGTVNIGGNARVLTSGQFLTFGTAPAGTFNTLYAAPTLTSQSLSFQELLGYDLLGADWTYNVSSPFDPSVNTMTVSVSPELIEVIDNIGRNTGQTYDVARVTQVFAGGTITSDWATDAVATRLVTWQTSNTQGVSNGLLADLNGVPIAPAQLDLGRTYTAQRPLEGEWQQTVGLTGGLSTLEITSGTVSTTLTVLGYEQVTVPVGQFLAIKYQSRIVMNGVVQGEVVIEENDPETDEDDVTINVTRPFQVVLNETGWAVPGVGVVQATTSRTFVVTGGGSSTQTLTRQLADVVLPD